MGMLRVIKPVLKLLFLKDKKNWLKSMMVRILSPNTEIVSEIKYTFYHNNSC